MAKIETTLLERERELHRLDEALSAAERGRGGIVLVSAPAGAGKTSLLLAASAAAVDAGFAPLRARATELERDFAFGVVRQLLEPLVAKASDAERDRLFAGAAALAKPLFAPFGTPSPPASSRDSPLSMLHGLYWLIDEIAERGPLALLVDDVHWADRESLSFLNYLAPRLDGIPVAVLASARDSEQFTADLARLTSAPETTVLRPQPLSSGAIATLCNRRLGATVAPELVAACREATGGNPFYLEALLREIGERGLPADSRQAARVRGIGPAAVADAVLVRLAERPAAATSLVRAVAVLGDGAELGETARLAELEVEAAARAADLLVTLAILERADRLTFSHPIVRESVYARITPHERVEAHARAIRILSAADASEERIAAQIVAAEPAGDAERVELLRRVAADALGRGAPAAAVAWLRRALNEPPAPASLGAVLLELGTAELRLGAPGAVEHLNAAVQRTTEPELLATAVRQLANALTISGEPHRAVAAIDSTIEIVADRDRELGLVLVAELASHAEQAGPEARRTAARRLESQPDLAGTTPAERLVLASIAFERARRSESAAEAARLLEDALADGRVVGEHQPDVFGPLYDLVLGLLATDALDLAEDCLERALTDARGLGSIPSVAYLTNRRGWVSLRRGAVALAEADARAGVELLSEHEIPLGLPFGVALLIESLIARGDAEAAEEALDRSGLEPEIPPGPTTNFLLSARARLHLARGRTGEALDDLFELGRRVERVGAANPLSSRWRSHAAIALVASGELDEARRLASEDLELARRWGARGGLGLALRASALAEDASVDRLREAVEVLERSPTRLEHARALVDLGAALRRGNRRSEARDALADGLELAQRCGTGKLADRARTELLAAGGRSADPYGSGIEQLTASERRVAELAAEGRSNPEIAQTLFVTRKTVETHLGHVYRKLDIAGRGELPRALAGEPDAAGRFEDSRG